MRYLPSILHTTSLHLYQKGYSLCIIYIIIHQLMFSLTLLTTQVQCMDCCVFLEHFTNCHCSFFNLICCLSFSFIIYMFHISLFFIVIPPSISFCKLEFFSNPSLSTLAPSDLISFPVNAWLCFFLSQSLENIYNLTIKTELFQCCVKHQHFSKFLCFIFNIIPCFT